MSKVLESLRRDIEVRIDAYNKQIVKKGDFAVMNRIESEIRDAEVAYGEEQMRETFSWCKKQEEPILAAVKRYDYPVLAHRLIREEGIVTGMELVEDRTKQIDLVKLCKVLGMSHLWEYKVERFGNLLCMRAAKELGWSDAQIKQIERLYYCNDLSKQEDMGTIPTSNNQIVKLLQQVIDAVLPMDEVTGKSKYRCNSHDVAYLLMAYTKRNGKKKLTIEVAKNSFVHRLVMDVMHRIVTGSVYDLKYQMKKEDSAVTVKKADAAEVKKAEVKKAEKEPASEKVSLQRPARKKVEAKPAEVSEPEADELPSIDEVPANEVA